MKGQFVGHYRISEQLGAGGMGVVYKAEDPRLGRCVAIKFFTGETTGSISVTRFLQEARTASSISHPHICTVHDVGEHEGRPYIVMEFLEGRNLKEELLEVKAGPDTIIAYGLQIAEALEAAHSRGIVHRDIKPANIFVTSEGPVKLVDFGIAHRTGESAETDASTQLTQTGATIGTVSYMSPEQALGRVVDHRSDFFSLGVVLYEMALGSHPFKDVTAASTIDAIVHQEPEQLGMAGSDIPLGLRTIIRKLIRKDPEKRYQSAAELIADLRQVQSGGAGSLWNFWIWPRRWAVAAALLLILVSGVTWRQGWLSSLARESPPDAEIPAALPISDRPIVAITRLAAVGGDSETEQIALGIAYTLATSLATVPSVTVISPASTLSLSEESQSPGRIAQEWGAEYLISGAVERIEERLRVNINLLRGEALVWGGSAQGNKDDLFGLQKDLVTQLSGALHLVLSDADRTRLTRAPTQDKQAYADYTQGRAFLERPDMEANLDRAQRLFEAALQKDPGFSLAHAALGDVYWARYEQTKDPEWTEKARRAIEKALELDPEQATVHASLGLLYTGTGEYQKALAALKRAQQLQPNNDEVYRLQGDALAALGDIEGAIEAYRQAIDLRPNFWGNQRALGQVYLTKGRYQKAAECFRRVTELQPDLSWGFHWLGVTYHAAGDLVRAQENYRKALALGPIAATHSNLGTIYYRRGDYAAAAEQYVQSLELKPASDAILRNLGDTYRKMDDATRSEAAYIEALELVRDQLSVNPKNAHLLAMAGLLEAKLGRYREANRHADQALALAPEDAIVQYRRAVVYALAGQDNEAVGQLRSALASGYSASEASKDDDLERIRARSDFQTLVTSK